MSWNMAYCFICSSPFVSAHLCLWQSRFRTPPLCWFQGNRVTYFREEKRKNGSSKPRLDFRCFFLFQSFLMDGVNIVFVPWYLVVFLAVTFWEMRKGVVGVRWFDEECERWLVASVCFVWLIAIVVVGDRSHATFSCQPKYHGAALLLFATLKVALVWYHSFGSLRNCARLTFLSLSQMQPKKKEKIRRFFCLFAVLIALLPSD